MYKYELVKLLEKVLYPSYEMKGGEHAFHCPFCNHHKKKLQVNFERFTLVIWEVRLPDMNWRAHLKSLEL